MPFTIKPAQPAVSVLGFTTVANTAGEALVQAYAMSQSGLLEVLVTDDYHRLYSLDELGRMAADEGSVRERQH